MPEEKERSSDEELQKLLKKSADVEDFPEVSLPAHPELREVVSAGGLSRRPSSS